MKVVVENAWRYKCPLCRAEYLPEDVPADGRCAECDDKPILRHRDSEFGAGLVVCLVKFSEHFDRTWQVPCELYWFRAGSRQRKELSREAEHTLAFEEGWWRDRPEYRTATNALEAAFEKAIERWAYAASDHLSEVDEALAPESLSKLVALVFRIRNKHLVDRPPTTFDDMKEIRRLWSAAAMELDRRLGTRPNWGEY